MTNAERLLGKAKYRISSPFGLRVHPITKEIEGHNGTDYSTYGQNVPCYAPADGKVLKVSMDQYGGKFVYVVFPKLNRVGLYYHLDQITVKVNKVVKKGDQIGIVGTTGRSTGIHLHFSWIKWNDAALKYYYADYEDFEKYKFPDEEEDEEDMKVYENINELTGDWKEAVEWALKKKIILGTGKTMGLRESEVKALVFQYRDNKRKGTL